jgi:hypothetical protein
MGADMALGICARHVDRHVAEARIRTLSNAVIGAAYNYGEDIEDDDTDYVARAIEDLAWVYEDRRATQIIRIDGKDYVVSGGMSWGDAPTDAYDPLNAIDILGVTELTFSTEVAQ